MSLHKALFLFKYLTSASLKEIFIEDDVTRYLLENCYLLEGQD